MKIYDISLSIHEGMPVYNNHPGKKPLIKTVKDFTQGSVYESRIEMDMHTGTHLDAPLHMLEGGSTLDCVDLSRVVTPCRVLDLSGVQDRIGEAELKGKGIRTGEFILLKTRNSKVEGFDPSFVFLDGSGARFLRDAGVGGVGIDALGIERSQPGHETHKILLGAGIVILEGLRLLQIEEGEYILFAPPLKIIGTEAAPARALLVQLNG